MKNFLPQRELPRKLRRESAESLLVSPLRISKVFISAFSFYITQQDLPSSIEPVIPRLLAYSVRRLILSGIPGLGPFIKGEGTPAEHVLSTGWRENLAVCYSRLQ